MIFNIGSVMTEYYVKKNGRQPQQNTINSYLSRLRQVYLAVGLEFGDDALFSDKLIEALQAVKDRFGNTSTRKTSYAGLVIFARALQLDQEIIDKIVNNMNVSIKKYNKEQQVKITKGDDLPVIKFLEIKKDLEKGIKNMVLEKKSIGRYQRATLVKWLIFNLYTLQPPVRNDYNSFVFLKEGEEEQEGKNYVDMINKKFIFNKYKTSMKYGRVEVFFREGMSDIIEKFSKFTGDGDYLFTKVNIKSGIETPYTSSHFSMLIKDVFSTGVSNLRKIFLTNKYSMIYDLLHEIDLDSVAMMNSPSIIKSHYIHKILKKVGDE